MMMHEKIKPHHLERKAILYVRAFHASTRSRAGSPRMMPRPRSHRLRRRQTWQRLPNNLGTVWSAPSTDARLKKRIARTVMHEVLADINADGMIVLLIHWMGGVHTELKLPRRRRGQRNSTSPNIVTAVRQLVLIANDDLIAGILNRNRLATGNGNRWTRESVTALRSYRKIPVFRPQPDGVEPWLNLSNAARRLGVAPKTLRLAAEAGQIEGVHPLPDGPWIFSRAELAKPEATQIVHRARKNPKHPTGSHPGQQNLFSSMA